MNNSLQFISLNISLQFISLIISLQFHSFSIEYLSSIFLLPFSIISAWYDHVQWVFLFNLVFCWPFLSQTNQHICIDLRHDFVVRIRASVSNSFPNETKVDYLCRFGPLTLKLSLNDLWQVIFKLSKNRCGPLTGPSSAYPPITAREHLENRWLSSSVQFTKNRWL